MPELPEVETVVRGLKATVRGRTIDSVITNAPASSIVVGASFHGKSFADILRGKKIQDISRRGKNILINLSDDTTLWTHLKMTGRFLYVSKENPVAKHDLAVFNFKDRAKNPNFHLRFNDTRRFGRLRLFRTAEVFHQKGLQELGPEPLEISANDFVKLFRATSRMIKPALLDQSFLAGIGNIYADESLYRAKIHPRKLTNRISPKKLAELHKQIRKILIKAIKHMGTSVDSYQGVNGQPGSFQKYLNAYDHEGKPCMICGHKIIREVIGSRSAHYCPRCQRL
ncbi:MAG: bifunctional DNA-formamidopyrimidine glycosylase/DNA-(apurinic or apyrimidinic site) lyase [Candidatus Zixiibacteriota bacterium]